MKFMKKRKNSFESPLYWTATPSDVRLTGSIGYNRVQEGTTGYNRVKEGTTGYRRVREDTTGYRRVQ